jgi:hypothetical protein
MNKQNDFSVTLEALDIPRVPARIVEVLLASEPASQSFASIMGVTSLSKAAVSGGLQYLEALGVLGYVRIDESRSRLIRLYPIRLANYLKRRMAHFDTLAVQLEDFAADISDDAYRQEITSLAQLFERLDANVNEIITNWEGEHAKQR